MKNIIYLLISIAIFSFQYVSIAKIDHHNNHNKSEKHKKEHGHEHEHGHSAGEHQHNLEEGKSTSKSSDNNAAKLEVIDGFTIAKIQTTAECDKCKKTIEKAINRLDGIKSSNLDVESRVFTVKFKSDEISLEKIKSIINKTGYDADETKADSKAYDRLPDCCKVGGMDK